MLSDYQGGYKQIITGDESWIYAYDPETTDQSSEYRLKDEAKPKIYIFHVTLFDCVKHCTILGDCTSSWFVSLSILISFTNTFEMTTG